MGWASDVLEKVFGKGKAPAIKNEADLPKDKPESGTVVIVVDQPKPEPTHTDTVIVIKPDAPIPSAPVIVTPPLPASTTVDKGIHTGVDLSHYHNVTNWTRLKGAIDFMYTKGTENLSYIDSKVENYVSKCLELKIPIGIYHVIHCGDGTVEKQVAFFLRVWKAHGGNLRPVLDYEGEVNKKNSTSRNKADCLSFMRMMRVSTGKKPIFYCNLSDVKEFAFSAAECEEFDMWVAAYRQSVPAVIGHHKKWLMWQHTDKRIVDGVGAVDSDYLYGKISDLA